MTDRFYFIQENGEQLGPFTFAEMGQRKLVGNVLVWYDDLDNWVKASEIVELKHLVIKAPPPITVPETDNVKNQGLRPSIDANKFYFKESIQWKIGDDFFSILFSTLLIVGLILFPTSQNQLGSFPIYFICWLIGSVIAFINCENIFIRKNFSLKFLQFLIGLIIIVLVGAIVMVYDQLNDLDNLVYNTNFGVFVLILLYLPFAVWFIASISSPREFKILARDHLTTIQQGLYATNSLQSLYDNHQYLTTYNLANRILKDLPENKDVIEYLILAGIKIEAFDKVSSLMEKLKEIESDSPVLKKYANLRGANSISSIKLDDVKNIESSYFAKRHDGGLVHKNIVNNVNVLTEKLSLAALNKENVSGPIVFATIYKMDAEDLGLAGEKMEFGEMVANNNGIGLVLYNAGDVFITNTIFLAVSYNELKEIRINKKKNIIEFCLLDNTSFKTYHKKSNFKYFILNENLFIRFVKSYNVKVVAVEY